MSDLNFTLIDVVQEPNGSHRAILPSTRAFTSGPQKVKDRDGSTVLPRTANYPLEADAGYQRAPWGATDDWPTRVREKFETVPLAYAELDRQARKLYGNGIWYYRLSDLAKGPNGLERAYIPEVEDWLEENEIMTEFLMPKLLDHKLHVNTFSEFVLGRNRQRIAGLFHKESEFCRLSRQDRRTRRIGYLLYSTYYGFYGDPPKGEQMAIPLLTWFDKQGFFRRLRGDRFAFHNRIRTPGIVYYARPAWTGLCRQNGWLDNAARVPEIVNTMMTNQAIIKYQIKIPSSYFELRYHETWGILSEAEREKKVDGYIKTLNAKLTDTDNVYKTLASIYEQDLNGNEKGFVEIIAIDDKMKKDQWVPTADMANWEIISALGGHPSSSGMKQGSNTMGGGSGSNLRELHNIEINHSTIEQQQLLWELNYVARFNKWGIRFAFDHTFHTTTNNQEDGLERSGRNIEPEGN